MITSINSQNAPAVVGPYSHSVATDSLVFLAGQIGIDMTTQELGVGIENQTRLALAHLEGVLISNGLTKNNVVKTTVFLANMDDYVKMNEVYASFFDSHKPARSTVQVAKLPKNALVEIEAIASR